MSINPIEEMQDRIGELEEVIAGHEAAGIYGLRRERDPLQVLPIHP